MIDTLDQYNVKTPSLEVVDEFTVIDGKQVKVVRSTEMNDEPEPSIHHHNNLDQPTIDLNRDVVGTILHSDLSSVTSDQHHAQLHAASHTSGGADDLTGITLANTILSGGRMTGGTVNTSSIGTMTATGGTATNLTLVTPTIGTPAITGGTANSLTLGTPTIADFTNAIHTHASNAQGGTVSHTSLSNIGTNTHAQIDTHIANEPATSIATHAAIAAAHHATVSMSGTPDYITLSGQDIVRGLIDLTTDVTGVLPNANVADDITLTNITQITNRSHTNLTDIGTNTHAQIDTHIAASGTAVHGLGNMSTQNSATVTITGGTITNINLVTPTIGTPTVTGGTVNPIAYQAGGTVGVDGTAVYVKTVDFGASSVTYGTVVFTKGIATSVS